MLRTDVAVLRTDVAVEIIATKVFTTMIALINLSGTPVGIWIFF